MRNKLIITPHSAFYSDKSIIEIREKAAQEAKKVIENQKPLNCVNNFYVQILKVFIYGFYIRFAYKVF